MLNKKSTLKTKIENKLPLFTGIGLLILWQVLAMMINIQHILPGPISILIKLWDRRKMLIFQNLPNTLLAIVIGFLLSILIGVLAAVLMDLSPKLEHMLYPTMVVTQTIPIMCIAPLFILWFGYTIYGRLLSIVLSCFFTITVNTFDGFKKTGREAIELMTTYGAKRKDIFWNLKVPTALPNFITSLKITFPWAVIGAAVAEWLGSTEGLGYYSKLMISRMDGAAVFATVLLLTLIALAGMAVIKAVDKKFIVWRSEV